MSHMLQKCTIWKVFEEFAKNPNKNYYIRELSRKLKLAHTSLRIHLKELEKLNLIKKEELGTYGSYISNFDNESFRFYKKMLNLISLKNSGLMIIST